MLKYFKIFFLFFIFSVAFPINTFAQFTDEELSAMGERITYFKSYITVEDDSSLTVKEVITVVSLGDTIKRGIYRDFPTSYKDKLGNNYKVKFDVIKVLRDGVKEDYHTESRSNGERVYFGNSNVFLDHGVYTYEFTYKTDSQLGFFEDHDELYWNVTGNGWIYNIDQVEAEISLPDNVPVDQIKIEAYTGKFNSKENDYVGNINTDGTVYFSATRSLMPSEGLTVVIGWPKGFVVEPTFGDKTGKFINENIFIAISTIILLICLYYYFYTWYNYGIDPKALAIVPQYESPRGMSPAEIRFLNTMGFGSKSMLTAAIINIAIKGFLTIKELTKNYRLQKNTPPQNSALSHEEKAIYDFIFDTTDTFEIKPENYSEIIHVEALLQAKLKEKFKSEYFVFNFKYLMYGIIISCIGIIFAILALSIEELIITIFMSIWLLFWTISLFAMTKGKFLEIIVKKNIRALFSSFLIIPFLIAEIFVIYLLVVSTSIFFTAYLLIMIVINILFAFLLTKRTEKGRLVQDEIEGFKLFLTMTEKDRMNFHNPPDKTPELFEKFLPYALVLGIENKWAEQFNEVFKKLDSDGIAYSPIWYSGKSLQASSMSSFASSMSNSIGHSISSSSNPPGSSSGFSGGGGGGSSGGGGGGGGGGGW